MIWHQPQELPDAPHRQDDSYARVRLTVRRAPSGARSEQSVLFVIDLAGVRSSTITKAPDSLTSGIVAGSGRTFQKRVTKIFKSWHIGLHT
jgi:hypothetical protein